MTDDDKIFLTFALKNGLVHSPCLEMGVGLEGTASKQLLNQYDIEFRGTDMIEGPDVDYVIDFEASEQEVCARVSDVDEFGSVLIFNVLEHTFEPIRILDNAMSLLRPGGTCVVLTPTIWPLHSFPIDCWRILPDFYREYAKRRGFSIVENSMEFIGRGEVGKYRDSEGHETLPHPARSKLYLRYSKIIHKLFNTCGRGMFYPSHVATGVVIRKE